MLSISGEARVVVTPTGQAERRFNQLWVNGQQLSYLGEGFQMRNDLSPFGAAPDVQGSVYYLPQTDQPALIVLKGKTLSLRPGFVSVNGTPLKEPYIRQSPRYEMPAYKVPVADYFCMGDNRNDSNDSHAWGPVDENRIVGKAMLIFWPLNRIRLLH